MCVRVLLNRLRLLKFQLKLSNSNRVRRCQEMEQLNTLGHNENQGESKEREGSPRNPGIVALFPATREKAPQNTSPGQSQPRQHNGHVHASTVNTVHHANKPNHLAFTISTAAMASGTYLDQLQGLRGVVVSLGLEVVLWLLHLRLRPRQWWRRGEWGRCLGRWQANHRASPSRGRPRWLGNGSFAGLQHSRSRG